MGIREDFEQARIDWMEEARNMTGEYPNKAKCCKWGACWMSERIIRKAEEAHSSDPQGFVSVEDIRQLSKDLSK